VKSKGRAERVQLRDRPAIRADQQWVVLALMSAV
jgi:hypothetical protein